MRIFLLLVLIISFSLSKPAYSQNRGADLFSDANLADAIASELDIDRRKLRASDLRELEVLDVMGRGITSLEGLQHAKNLKALRISRI